MECTEMTCEAIATDHDIGDPGCSYEEFPAGSGEIISKLDPIDDE